MVIRKGLNTIIAGLLLVSIGIFGFSSTACDSEQAVENSPAPDSIGKGLSKMDSRLSQLVSAAEGGEAALFAERNNIELSDGSVRVIIECASGQLEVARQAAINSGAEVETTYENLLQISVPVTSLTALTEAESIRFIRLPPRCPRESPRISSSWLIGMSPPGNG